MDNIKIIVVLNIILVMLQITREALGFMRDLKNDKKNSDQKENGGE